MSRIGTDHLARTAFVYIRQSTPEQVRHNLESQRRQYALAERVRTLGWREVVVLDEDLGRSGSGVKRPGFELCLRRYVKARSARWSRSRPRDWLETGATGTRCSSSVPSWARLSSMRRESMIRACPTTGSCSV